MCSNWFDSPLPLTTKLCFPRDFHALGGFQKLCCGFVVFPKVQVLGSNPKAPTSIVSEVFSMCLANTQYLCCRTGRWKPWGIGKIR